MALNATFVGVGRRNRFFLCMCSRSCFIAIIIVINIIVFIFVVMCQNRQVIVTYLGCCWCSGGVP